MRDVHQQVLFLEGLDDGREHYRHDLQGGGRDGGLCYQDAGVEVVRRYVLRELPHLLYPDGGVGAELDPDGADAGGWWGGVQGRGEVAVFFDHGGGGTGGEGHFFAAARGEVLVDGMGGGEGLERVRSLGAAVRVGVLVAEFVERNSYFFFC